MVVICNEIKVIDLIQILSPGKNLNKIDYNNSRAHFYWIFGPWNLNLVLGFSDDIIRFDTKKNHLVWKLNEEFSIYL